MPATSRPQVEAEAPAPASRGEALVALLVIGLATVLVYSNTFDASFHFDDFANIVRKESLRDLRSQWPPSGNRYLGYLSFALNYRLGGQEVFGYHLANLLIHLCNSLLVFWLVTATLRTPAARRAEAGPLVRRFLPLAAALLFAVHPLATQAVTYIVQRFASLATLFFLLSMTLHVQARLSLEAGRPSRARAAWLYSLSVAAAVAAMKTKQMSFTLPFVAIMYELLFFRFGRRVLLLAPLAATCLLVPLGLATQGQSLGDVLSEASDMAVETREIPRSVYLLTQSRVVVTYIRLLLLPIGQNVDYDFALSHSLGDGGVLSSIAVLLGVAGLAVFLLRRALTTNGLPGILVFFGIAWFFVTLSVESSLIPIRDVIFEHRVYLPSAGSAIALGSTLLWAVERLHLRFSLVLQAAAALLITTGPLGIAAYARNAVWKDELTLWSDAVAKSPRKARPHYNLGLAYQTNGQIDDAMREYREAIRLAPTAAAHTNLGNAHYAKGQIDDAIREHREAIRLDPGNSEAHNSLGADYQARGQLDDAMREYREAIRIAPKYPEAHQSLGLAHYAKGQLDDAMREYREAIRIAPGFAPAYITLGNVYQAKGQLEDAMREYREAMRVDPANAEAYNNVGVILLKQGRAAEAVEEVRRALELRSTLDTLFNLAITLDAAGRSAEAIVHYQRFLREVGHNHPDRAEMARGRIARLRPSPPPGSP